MQSLITPTSSTGPGPQPPPGRWTWRLIGALTAGALALLLAVVVDRTGNHPPAPQVNTVTRTATVTEAVTSLSVTSDGGDIRVTQGPVSRVTVTEQFAYLASERPPGVTAQVAHGRLTLAPHSQFGYYSVAFTVTVPAGVAVTATSGGGHHGPRHQ